MSAWVKRLRRPTLRSIQQNQSLGARYLRFDGLGSVSSPLDRRGIGDALSVLEELANRGRCLVALPNETMLALYVLDADAGSLRLMWYEPERRLVAADPAQRWEVQLQATSGTLVDR